MEKRPPRPMTPFDEMIIPQELHMLKLFLPYTPPSNQPFLGVFIKFLELKETISFFKDYGSNLHTQAFNRNHPPSPTEMLTDLKPYMPPEQAEMMDSFLNMMNIMEMMQMFQGNADNTEGNPFADMANMFGGNDSKTGNTNGMSGTGDTDGMNSMGNMANMANMFSGGFNPMDMMMGMMTPEQQNMFQMYNNMFANEINSGEAPPENAADNAAPGYEPSVSETASDNTDDNFGWKGDDIDERMDEQPGNEEY